MGLCAAFCLLGALLLAHAVVAQLERCEFGSTCPRALDDCSALSDNRLVPCPEDGNFCFCAPDSDSDLQRCGSGTDCGEGQRCGILPGSTSEAFCVGCRSIVVTVIPPNSCTPPSQRPLPSRVPPVTVMPTTTPAPDVVDEDEEEDMPTVMPTVSMMPQGTDPPSPTEVFEVEPTPVMEDPSVSVIPVMPTESEVPIPEPNFTDEDSDGGDDIDGMGESNEPSLMPMVPSMSMTMMPSASPSMMITPIRTPAPSVVDIDEDEEDEEEDDIPSTPGDSFMVESPTVSIAPDMSTPPMADVSMSPEISTTSPEAGVENDSPETGSEIDGEEASPTAEEPICIDAAALSHFSPDNLVFSSHRRAAVLCDSHGSCATPGHMVHYQGSAMMMRSYCEQVGSCMRSVRWVNSPKFQRALRVDSRTDGLSFLAFAARYESKAEEHVLRTLVRLGM